MSSKLQKVHADKIATKLGAEVRKGGKHLIAMVYIDGIEVTRFGIRHGRTEGHGHLTTQLWISETQAVAMATCTMSKDEWLIRARAQGKVAPEEVIQPPAPPILKKKAKR